MTRDEAADLALKLFKSGTIAEIRLLSCQDTSWEVIVPWHCPEKGTTKMRYLIQVWFRQSDKGAVQVVAKGKPTKADAFLWAAYQLGLCRAKGYVVTEVILRDDLGNRVELPRELHDLWATVKN